MTDVDNYSYNYGGNGNTYQAQDGRYYSDITTMNWVNQGLEPYEPWGGYVAAEPANNVYNAYSGYVAPANNEYNGPNYNYEVYSYKDPWNPKPIEFRIYPRKGSAVDEDEVKPNWVHDHERIECATVDCDYSFSGKKHGGRHHCRKCGDVFCTKCVDYKVSWKHTKLYKHSKNLKSMASGLKGKVKICRSCWRKIKG